MTDIVQEEVFEMLSVANERGAPDFTLALLRNKLESIKAWPGICDLFDEEDFENAIVEALNARTVQIFQEHAAVSPNTIRLIARPCFGSIVPDFAYALNRLKAVFGDAFSMSRVFDGEGLAERLVYASKEIADAEKRGIKLEVIDLAANYIPGLPEGAGWRPVNVRSSASAHVQVLYAAAHEPEWVRQMNPLQGRPFPLMGGYVVYRDGIPCVPNLFGTVRVSAIPETTRCRERSMPVILS